MDTGEISRAAWTCRWGRFGTQPESCSTDGSDDLVWTCCRSALCPALRVVLEKECEACSYWEPGIVPPCAAMGWSEE